MRDTTEMRRGRFGTLIAGLMLGAATAAWAMPAAPESLAPGWQAFVGCWEPIAQPVGALPDSARTHLVCIVPVAGTSAVDMVTVVDGKVVERERVDATGTQYPTRKDDCAGTRSAAWSTVGQRLYVRSELVCEGGLRRTSTGVISMTSMNEWMDVQTVAVGEQKAVRVLRYREARQGAAIPTEITAALGNRPFSASAARLAATAPVSSADIVDVSRHLDAAGVEVWLLEQKLGFTADAKGLVELTEAGVPGSVVDVVVALSYPRRFTIDVNQREIELLPAESRVGGSPLRSRISGYDGSWDPYYNSRYGRQYYSPYGYSQYGYGYGYGTGYGWYPGGRPVIIVTDPTPSEPRVDGKAVKGRGYTRSRPATADPTPDTRAGSSSSSGQGSSGSSSGSGTSSGTTGSSGSSSSGSSSGESTGRTAKVRPPPSGTN